MNDVSDGNTLAAQRTSVADTASSAGPQSELTLVGVIGGRVDDAFHPKRTSVAAPQTRP